MQYCDGVLMDCFKLGVIFDFVFQIYLFEYVECGFFLGIIKIRVVFGFNCFVQLLVIKIIFELESFVVIFGGNDFSFFILDEVYKGEQLGVDGDNSFGWLFRGVWIYNSDVVVMCGKGKSIFVGGESYRVNLIS